MTCDEKGILKALKARQSIREAAARFGVSASKVQRVMAGVIGIEIDRRH